jgi:hypothetical protein
VPTHVGHVRRGAIPGPRLAIGWLVVHRRVRHSRVLHTRGLCLFCTHTHSQSGRFGLRSPPLAAAPVAPSPPSPPSVWCTLSSGRAPSLLGCLVGRLGHAPTSQGCCLAPGAGACPRFLFMAASCPPFAPTQCGSRGRFPRLRQRLAFALAAAFAVAAVVSARAVAVLVLRG